MKKLLPPFRLRACGLLLALPAALAAWPALAATEVPATDTANGAVTTPADMMRVAHDALLVGDNEKAIRFYTAVLAQPGTPYAQEAQELLGVARERNGQPAQAKAEYETYLRLYPEGDGAERVRQRLLGLVTAREASPEALRKVESADGASGWESFGSVMESYRWDQSTNGGITRTDQSALVTDLDYSMRRHGSSYDVRTRITGEYRYDFLGRLKKGNNTRLRNLYLEALSTGTGFSGSIGRQSRSDNGLLGRFDGAIISKPITGSTRVNVVAGKPVEYGTDYSINRHKQFYGASFDVANIAGAGDVNAYYIKQTIDSIKDREAVGTQARYVKGHGSLFALADYDISYKALNNFITMGSLATADGTAYSVLFDYRMGPTLSTSNALIGQTATTIKDLLATYSESEIRKLARDRTTVSRSGTVSVSKPLNDKSQVIGDVTLSSMSGTPASGGVTAFEPSGLEQYYTAQFITSDFWQSGDTAVFGARYGTNKFANTASVNMNYRRLIGNRIYLNPKGRVDVRSSKSNGNDVTLAAAVLMSREVIRDLTVEGEVGAEFGQRTVYSGKGNHDAFYLYLGVRKDFQTN